jgi:tetratricopeptide (TPR) repeat protein
VPTPTVFLSYSHKDEIWKDRLVAHLNVLEREGLLQTWNDGQIRAGADWLPEIQGAMQRARVAVLLLSADFLRSDFIRGREVPELLARRNGGGLHVVPVIVRDCVWEEVQCLSGLQARPRDRKPLNKFTVANRETEIKKIALEILNLLREDQEEIGVARSEEEKSTGRDGLRPLHQLPSPPSDFTGRAAELAELRAAIETGGVTLSGVRGLGGIGKTTLALKLAEELSPRYPDAQIYLDLRGVSPAPLKTAEAMAHVIRSFQPEARLPEDETALAGLYRSVLHDRRVLLLMDNAAHAAQVQPLIPPKGSILLVTSRAKFTLPGLLSKDLDELPPGDARALLLNIAPRIGTEAARLADLCGHLPLALRLTASTLADRPDLSPARCAQRLATEQGRLGLIDGSLSLSFELLPESLSRSWTALAVFPVTFDTEAAAAVWEIDLEAAEEGLGELVKRSLIEGEDGRYRLHDLVRVFAGHRLVEPERSVAQRRHAGYYEEVLALADDLFKAGGKQILEGLRLFDGEWANIQAGQGWAVAHAESDQEATKLARGYPEAGVFCLLLRLRPRQRVRWLEAGLKASRALDDREAEGGILGSLGSAYAELGEFQRAIEFHEQSLVIAREVGDRLGESAALGSLGNVHVDLGEPFRAIELCEQDLTISRELGDRFGEGAALGNLGRAYAGLGEIRRAIELFFQQLAIALEVGDRQSESTACWTLGLISETNGDLALAVELMEIGVDIERELGHIDAEKHAAQVEALRARISLRRDGGI